MTATWHTTTPNPYSVNALSRGGTANQGNRLLEFLRNDDIAVGAVRVSESIVDADLIDQLVKLSGLEIVLICRDRMYYRTSVSKPRWHYVTAEEKSKRMMELAKPFEDAKSLVHQHLPNVQVADGLWD